MFLSAGLLFLATVVFVKLVCAALAPKSKKELPPTVKTLPIIGGLLRFMKGPIPMIREEYKKLGSVFTVNVVNWRITFFIGPEVSAHFFKAPEVELSQQEVYRFNVPTFGPGVVFDVDYSIRQEQFRFFTEALRVTKLRSYVDQMVMETEVNLSKSIKDGSFLCCNLYWLYTLMTFSLYILLLLKVCSEWFDLLALIKNGYLDEINKLLMKLIYKNFSD